MDNYNPNTYFDLSQFPYSDIFDDVTNVWEVISKIKKYSKNALLTGKNCSVHKEAVIREGVILGNNVHIGKFAELKNCIVMSNSFVPHFSYVGDSVVGNNVNIAAGVKISNTRLDEQTVKVKTQGRRIDTNLTKFGAIIGDNTKTGANSVTNPGTLIGKKSVIFPLTQVSGVHREQSVIR